MNKIEKSDVGYRKGDVIGQSYEVHQYAGDVDAPVALTDSDLHEGEKQ